LVEVSDRETLATTFDHYVLMPNQPDQDGRVFRDKAQRVVGKLWVSLPSQYIALLNTYY
jgi:hypothetical protein